MCIGYKVYSLKKKYITKLYILTTIREKYVV